MHHAHLPDNAHSMLRSGPVMMVNDAAIQRNFKKLAEMAKGECAAIVKGDAYGHGMRESARALREAGARLFFSARFDDALVLRSDLGAIPRIAALDGIPGGRLPEAEQHRITAVLNSLEQLEAAADHARRSGHKMRAFVHIDTAMNRLGLATHEIERAAPLMDAIEVQAYMTHLACADDVNLDLCQQQVRRLRHACRNLPAAPVSIANSSGTFLGEEYHGDIIRPGKSTFGINPLPLGINPLEEPATVLASIVDIRELAKGAPVGYSSTWHAPHTCRIAILAIGYANGFMRSNSNRGAVYVCGKLAPVVGRVSMDLTAVDVTSVPPDLIHQGTVAEIIGPSISYRDYAGQAGTIEHEALIALGRGCRRVHICN